MFPSKVLAEAVESFIKSARVKSAWPITLQYFLCALGVPCASARTLLENPSIPRCLVNARLAVVVQARILRVPVDFTAAILVRLPPAENEQQVG